MWYDLGFKSIIVFMVLRLVFNEIGMEEGDKLRGYYINLVVRCVGSIRMVVKKVVWSGCFYDIFKK